MSDTGHTPREEPAAWRKRVGRSDRHATDVWKWSEWTDGKWPDDYEDREFVRYESQPLYTSASPSLPLLVEALKPFARIADMEEGAEPSASVMVNVSRCRDARAVLASIKGGQ